MAHDSLAALAALEQRYDGPIPEAARLVARHGSREAVALLAAAGEAAYFASLVTGQLRAIRRRRADGSFYPEMLDDLAFYRRERQRWRQAERLARQALAALR